MKDLEDGVRCAYDHGVCNAHRSNVVHSRGAAGYSHDFTPPEPLPKKKFNALAQDITKRILADHPGEFTPKAVRLVVRSVLPAILQYDEVLRFLARL